MVDIRSQGVQHALETPHHTAVWEVLRRLARPASVAEISNITGMDAKGVQRSMDVLTDAGLAERLPSRANRRHSTYRTRSETVVVTFEPADREQRLAIERVTSVLRDHVRRQMDGSESRSEAEADGASASWRFDAHRLVSLESEEAEELRRMLQELLSFLESAQARITKANADDAAASNTCVSIQVAGTAGGCIPTAALHFVPRDGVDDYVRGSLANGMHLLSPREREVALMLASGRSRPEIARELGVTTNTVATIGKRIYAKLGVRRRAELSNRVRRAGA